MGKANNMVRARVTIRGTRPLLFHVFGPESIPLETQEKTGKAGNDPEEWRRSYLATPEGQLYVRGDYVFGCLRDGAKHTRKGKGSIQPLLAATLQVEESVVLLNRVLPKAGDPPRDPAAETYLDVRGCRNPSTKARNVRYRLACSPGWECSFTLLWDKTIVSREQMQAVLHDASILVGIGDGRSIGNGRFTVTSYKELDGAEEEAAAGSLEEAEGNRVAPRRKALRPLPDGVAAG